MAGVILHSEPSIEVKAAMRVKIAELLGLDATRVNVKAKTGEKVGAIGRAEAIGCQAAVLIDNVS